MKSVGQKRIRKVAKVIFPASARSAVESGENPFHSCVNTSSSPLFPRFIHKQGPRLSIFILHFIPVAIQLEQRKLFNDKCIFRWTAMRISEDHWN